MFLNTVFVFPLSNSEPIIFPKQRGKFRQMNYMAEETQEEQLWDVGAREKYHQVRSLREGRAQKVMGKSCYSR